MLAAIYRRVSTDHQDNSLEVQEHLNDEYARRLGFEVLRRPTGEVMPRAGSTGPTGGVFEDADVSGSVPFLERIGGLSLMNRLKHGDVQHLITAKQDRLGRDTIDTIATIRRIWEMGITPHFTCEGGAFSRSPQNELLFEIKASVAQYERNLIRERTRTVLRHKFNQGQLTGNVPFGYDVEYHFADGTTYISPRALSAVELAAVNTSKVASKPLIANPTEQQTLRYMSDLRRAGWKLEALATHLNTLGRHPKLGGLWQAGNVASVLQSRHTARLLSSATGEAHAA